MSIRSSSLMVLFSFSRSLMIFCLFVLSSFGEGGVGISKNNCGFVHFSFWFCQFCIFFFNAFDH